jgi:hypothetical protein
MGLRAAGKLGSLTRMRIDASQLHAELSTALAAFGDAPDATALWALGRMLFRPPLKMYADEVRRRLFRAAGDIKQKLLDTDDERDRVAVATILENLGVLRSREGILRRTWLRNEEGRVWKALRDIQEALDQGRLPYGALASEWLNDSGVISQVAQSLTENVAGELAESTGGEMKGLVERLGSALARVGEWTRLADELNEAEQLERFEAAYEEIEKVLEGRGLPKRFPAGARDVVVYRAAAVRLARAVLVDLALQPHVHHSMLRLRVHLETFVRDGLVEDLKAAPGQHETVLQRAMDSFLFAEGLFPLTHFQLANGALDTAFEMRRDAAKEQSNILHAPPALIELKQVVQLKSEPTETELRKAVEEGAKQAVAYRSHLGALWPTCLPYVVVAYDGKTIYSPSTTNERIILVYLGTSTPSKTKKGLEVKLPVGF